MDQERQPGTRAAGDEETAADPGLCGTCRHAEQIHGARSLFWLCARSRTDPAFPRYPRLPVRACRGYEPSVKRET